MEAQKSVLNRITKSLKKKKTELEKKITSLENMAYNCAKKKNGDLAKKDKMFRSMEGKIKKMVLDLKLRDTALKSKREKV